MADKYESLRKCLRSELERVDGPLFPDVIQAINSELECLCSDGVIGFGNDYSLSGFPLEWRVREIFRTMGFEAIRGRDGMEDFIVQASDDAKPPIPLVFGGKIKQEATYRTR